MSKAALYKTILASYSRSNGQSSLRSKGLYNKSSAKRRLRKNRRSKSKFFIGVEICLESQETTLQGLAIAMCPHGESGLPAGDL